MGLGVVLAKLLGKKLGKALIPDTETLHGITYMNPIKYTYKQRIADLTHEKVGVCNSYLKDLIEQAHKKGDMEGLKTIYAYLHSKVNDLPPQVTSSLLKKIVIYGNEIKFHHIMGDPFALIEKVVHHLC